MRILTFFLAVLCGVAASGSVAVAQVVAVEPEFLAIGFSKNSSRERGVGVWKKGATRVEIFDKKRFFNLNGTRVYLGNATSFDKGKFFIRKHDWEKHVAPLAAPKKFSMPKKIVIDPGHGGKDPGKINKRGMKEKNYALDIAQRVARILKTRGYDVSLTRTNDTFVELADRPARANERKADLFISIHLNSAASAAARGVETFALTPVGEASTSGGSAKKAADVGNARDAQNTLLAFKLHAAVVGKIDAEDRGVKYANFAVLKTLKCPGALIECGFLTNTSDTALVATKNGRERIATGIADGVDAYARAGGNRVPARRK